MQRLKDPETQYHGLTLPEVVQGAPETAVNALDAAVAAYVNVSLLRQQIPDAYRVHGTIAGSESWSANGTSMRSWYVPPRLSTLTFPPQSSKVIPSQAKVMYGIRAPTANGVMDLVPRVLNCFKAAALSTGCSYEITKEIMYLDLQPCKTLETYFAEFCKETWGGEGYEVPEGSMTGGSTDFVSVLS
jgi:metal-dependent amidase/aminoacylase/carboxypeptidase family protein